MRQSTYLFKRQTTEVIALSPEGAPESGWIPSGDNGVFKQWQFALSDLVGEGSTDFTALFKRYKINAVKVDIAFNNTGSVLAGTSGASALGAGGQLQVYTTPNRNGRVRTFLSNPLTEAELLNTQAKRKRLALNGGKPLSFYMKVNQLGMVYVSQTDTDYAVQRPQYISTGETQAAHYGYEMYINRVDGQALAVNMSGQQSMRVTTTYFMSFKGVE